MENQVVYGFLLVAVFGVIFIGLVSLFDRWAKLAERNNELQAELEAARKQIHDYEWKNEQAIDEIALYHRRYEQHQKEKQEWLKSRIELFVDVDYDKENDDDDDEATYVFVPEGGSYVDENGYAGLQAMEVAEVQTPTRGKAFPATNNIETWKRDCPRDGIKRIYDKFNAGHALIGTQSVGNGSYERFRFRLEHAGQVYQSKCFASRYDAISFRNNVFIAFGFPVFNHQIGTTKKQGEIQ